MPILGQCGCKAGTYDSNGLGLCVACNPLCATCDNATKCMVCKSGIVGRNTIAVNGLCPCIVKLFFFYGLNLF